MHDDELDTYQNTYLWNPGGVRDKLETLRAARLKEESENMAGVQSRMNRQMMAALSAGQNSGIQGLPADAQEHLHAAALELGVELRQIVEFGEAQVRLCLNNNTIPNPNLKNIMMCEGFLMGKKGAKAASVAKRMADDDVFGCDVGEDVAQAMNWLRAIYEIETGEEL